MAEQKYLVLDFGASHGRCIVAKYDGESFEMETVHEFDNIPVRFAGTLYWDVLRLANEAKTGIKAAYQRHRDLCSVGIDTWGCDFGYLDKGGRLLENPVNYRDEARYIYKKELDEAFGEYEIFKLGGTNTNNIMGLYELYAQKQQDASALCAAERLLMMPDLLNYNLTGVAVNEYTNATMTLMVDQENKQWEKRFFEQLKLPEHICGEILQPGTLIGEIQPAVAHDYEVPQLPVVAVATHDTASAMAGVPVSAEQTQDWAYISLGTWAIFGVEGNTIHRDRRTFELGFANQGGCEGKTNLVNLFTGLWVIQECHKRWSEEAGRKLKWDEVIDAAQKAGGGRAFIDLDAEEFAHPNPNMPLRIQEYQKKCGGYVPQGMGEVARCVYDSLVLAIKYCGLAIERITGKKLELLHVVGGGSKSSVLCQWIADAIGVHVKAGPAETTSVGNLLMQMKGLGHIASLQAGRQIAARSADTKDYYPAKGGGWDDLFERYMKAVGKTI